MFNTSLCQKPTHVVTFIFQIIINVPTCEYHVWCLRGVGLGAVCLFWFYFGKLLLVFLRLHCVGIEC